jgi:hypothetical protein
VLSAEVNSTVVVNCQQEMCSGVLSLALDRLGHTHRHRRQVNPLCIDVIPSGAQLASFSPRSLYGTIMDGRLPCGDRTYNGESAKEGYDRLVWGNPTLKG